MYEEAKEWSQSSGKKSWLWIILYGGKFITCQEKKIAQNNKLVLIPTHSSWSLVSRLSLLF